MFIPGISYGQVPLLLDILAHLGDTIPDVQPATINHFQVHGENPNFYFINYSRNSPTSGEMSESEMQDFQWNWVIQGNALKVDLVSIPFSIISWNCNGTFPLILQATHIETQAVYEQPIPTYVIWYDIPYPECDYGLDLNDVNNFNIWEYYTPYQYLIQESPYDLNGDRVINVYDILTLLTQ